MIKLTDILLEAKSPDIFVPRRTEDRLERYIKAFIRNDLDNPEARLDLIESNLTVLPEVLNGLEIKGSFRCSYNKLTSLKNSPRIVDGNFICDRSGLSSLEGGPEYVGGDFQCQDNRLKSLDGCPKIVVGDFVCFKNAVVFKFKEIRKVCKVIGRINTDDGFY